MCHDLLRQLIERVDATCLESGIPSLGHLAEYGWEGNIEEGIEGALNLLESL